MVRLTILASVILVEFASTAIAYESSRPAEENVTTQSTASTAARGDSRQGKCGIQMAASYPIRLLD